MDLQNEVLQKTFKVKKYLGEWFEIGSTPNFFEIGCESAKARYELKSDGTIFVVNTCLDEDGDPKTRTCEEAGGIGCRGFNNTVPPKICGTAQIVDPQFPAALRVRFPGEFEIPETGGPNYLVHKTDYKKYSVVGDPNRRFLFILSRKPYMSKKLFDELLSFAKSLGYDTNSFVINTREDKSVVV